ncbi:DeoR/GlpR family DNA-binding transcription regulator [Geminicoccus harenae]|uniref:DeoR/GlpR family DNA-binding transcription regulator n=1 Tax=Geminicoccus harenae TaxID=2498453 RepID=UPI00168A687A|nr:DeoR/GlpR family DNA-binding transcription regulator [Geminicoccus harenae]
MKSSARRQRIIDALMEQGSVQVDDLATSLRVSRMTIHRDLDMLESDGIVCKVRGGATIQSNTLFESDFRYRERVALEEKRLLAEAAAELIEPGQAIILDGGTTIQALAPLLVQRRPLTVITNSLGICTALAEAPGISLIGLGGIYSRHYHGFMGALAERMLADLRANLLFMSTAAVCGRTAFHQDPQVAQVKRAMIAAAERRFLLVDHSKFGKTALNVLTDLTAFEAVFTGSALPQGVRRELAGQGVTLRIVQVPERVGRPADMVIGSEVAP